MPLFRIVMLLSLLLVPRLAPGADLPARYTADEKQLKAALAGTMLTFQLYSDALCTASVYSTAIAIENVDLIGRIKPFNPKNAVKKKNTTELRATLTGVPPGPSLYLKVTGTGVTPIGGACQVQASGLSGPSGASPLVVKDSLAVTVGTFDGQSSAIYDDAGALIRLSMTSVGFTQDFLYGTYFTANNCTGPNLQSVDPSLVRFARIIGTTAYYPPQSGSSMNVSSQLYRSGSVPLANQADCDTLFGIGNSTFVPPDGCCQSFPSFASPMGPEATVSIGGFVPPFSVQ